MMTPKLIPPPRLIMPQGGGDAILRGDMASFVKATFAEITPGTQLQWAPYLDLICAKLAAVAAGDIRHLIITLPPRHLKSVCVSVALPAFFLGHNPSASVMAVSYAQELANGFAAYTRKVMVSDFYQRIFPTRLVSARQPLKQLKTTGGGVRRATSIDGTATGFGADLMIFDDPQKPYETASEAMRKSSNLAFANTFMARRNNPSQARIIIVMQRLHEDDFVGNAVSLGIDWEVLNLPAIAEEDEAIAYRTKLGRFMYRRDEGEPLHAARISLDEYGVIRASMGEAGWATQYQQRPAPAGGGIVQVVWFQRYTSADLPKSWDRVVQSWDTASKVGELNDYSVCTTWGVKDKKRYLLHVWRRRVSYPDLKRAVIELRKLHHATTVIIANISQVINSAPHRTPPRSAERWRPG